jgi:hypothetical protein
MRVEDGCWHEDTHSGHAPIWEVIKHDDVLVHLGIFCYEKKYI